MAPNFARFMYGWMILLTVWMALLTVEMIGRAPVTVAAADETRVLDVRDPVLVRWEVGDGTERWEALPPRTMPLWQYVKEGDEATAKRLRMFEAAFEQDLHNGDKSFHLTHELIDGKTW